MASPNHTGSRLRRFGTGLLLLACCAGPVLIASGAGDPAVRAIRAAVGGPIPLGAGLVAAVAAAIVAAALLGRPKRRSPRGGGPIDRRRTDRLFK
jgi:hypothetical protein